MIDATRSMIGFYSYQLVTLSIFIAIFDPYAGLELADPHNAPMSPGGPDCRDGGPVHAILYCPGDDECGEHFDPWYHGCQRGHVAGARGCDTDLNNGPSLLLGEAAGRGQIPRTPRSRTGCHGRGEPRRQGCPGECSGGEAVWLCATRVAPTRH